MRWAAGSSACLREREHVLISDDKIFATFFDRRIHHSTNRQAQAIDAQTECTGS